MAAEADPLDAIKTILSANWNNANTNSITPTFYLSSEQPGRLDYTGGGAIILIYLASHTTDPNGLGASHREKTVDRVSIDIRTRMSRAHVRNCYNECRRIFGSRINFPVGDTTFAQLMPINMTDFTTMGFYRYVYDIYLKNWIVAR